MRAASNTGHCVKGGAVAGIVGGVAIAAFMTLVNIAQRKDLWMGLKGAGAPFLHNRALQPGFDPMAVLVGVFSHFAVSIVWGVLFGLLFFGFSRSSTVLIGALWGIVVWLGMYYLVLPVLGLSALAAGAPIGMAIVEHLIFGLGVGIGFLPFQRPRPAIPTRTATQP